MYVFSNDPEECGFTTNDLSGGALEIEKCLKCLDGYLIVKRVKDENGHDTGRRMLGCTNYRKDGTGCDFTVFDEKLDSLEKISRDFGTYLKNSLPIDSCVLLGYPVKQLVKGVVYVAGVGEKMGMKMTRNSLVHFLQGVPDRS